MNETLYTRTHSVVYASATLTVNGKFDTFADAVGLNKGEFSQSKFIELDSSYDFDNNMIIYVVSDIPEPNDPQYLSMRNFALTGNAIREDYMFDEIPNHLDPLNYSHFDESPMKLITVASNIELGEADYHVMENGRDTRYLLASASIPLVSQIIELDGKKLLDGGSCDSVPVTYSRLLGNTDKHIVVLTHHADFVKRPNRVMPLANRVYSDYPLFVERLEYRHYEYNRLYRMILRLHDEGVSFAIFPPEPVEVANMEKDPAKLFALYEQGYAHAAEQWDALSAYLAR
jgi:predicted patatin/cPLA2 family phospholipase